MQIRPGDVTASAERRLLDDYFDYRAAAFPEQFGDYIVSYPPAETFSGTQGVFLVVEDDEGRLVGCGGIRLLASPRAGIVRYEVKHVWLSPETRGRGWAGQLMLAFEESAREFGATELVLDTHHSLESAARLYDRLGYVTVEAYNDNPNATRWYAKQLDR